MTTVKLFKQGHSIVAAIPRYFRTILKLNAGDVLVVESSDDALTMRKLNQHSARERARAAAATAASGDANGPQS